MVFRCKIQIFLFQNSVAKFKCPDLFPNVMLAVCVLLEKLSVLSGHHGSGPGFVYQVFHFAYLKRMQTCTYFFCQDLRVHQMVNAKLHILRKNILSNTYDGLLAMKLDS